MLEIDRVTKSFNGVCAVKEFSLLLQPEKITSLIGPNGAGKSTVFNLVTGFLPLSRGDVKYDGRSITGLAPWRIAQLGVIRTFQNIRLFRNFTVIENVLLGIKNQSGENIFNALFIFSKNSREHIKHLELACSILEFVGLIDNKYELAENLSYGQQKLLSIACALAVDPKVLLLDEPVSGLHPEIIEKIITILKDLVKKEHKTIWIIEHDIDFVVKISDTILVMDDGSLITNDSPQNIQNNPVILESYLS